jgi:hypothetical protein
MLDTLDNIQRLEFSDLSLDSSWFMKTASLPEAQLLELTDLYIASFNRAPDSLGLNYWGARLNDGMSLPDIARSFFTQPEMAATYAAGLSSKAFFTTVYANVLGRTPDEGGLAYWTGQLDAGNITRDVSLLAVLSGARGMPDAQYLQNKEVVGAYFALPQGLNDVLWAQTVMQSVDASAESVALARSLTDLFARTANTASNSAMVVNVTGISEASWAIPSV